MLPRSGTTAELATGCGPAVLHRDRVTMVVPGTAEIVALTSIQIFLPITGTTWTVVLSTASAFPELTGGLEKLMRSVAEGISTVDPGADRTTATDKATDDGLDEQWMPADPDTGGPKVGFERGLRTVVLRPNRPAIHKCPGGRQAGSLRRDSPTRSVRPVGRVTNQPRPRAVLQAHATRARAALALLLHARDRGPRDMRNPLGSLIGSMVVAVVIVVVAVVGARIGMLIGPREAQASPHIRCRPRFDPALHSRPNHGHGEIAILSMVCDA